MDEPNQTTDSLAALISRAAQNTKGLPPVEKWHPEFCRDLDIEIKRDGSWTYQGSLIAREAMVRLFSTVLRKDDDGRTYLVTPVEKVGIKVEDAPFVAVEMDRNLVEGQPVLTFRTQVGDVVEAGPQNPMRFEIMEENQGLKPYLLVRGRLEALLTRAVTHELVSWGEEIEVAGIAMFAVRSKGAIFPMMAMDEINAAAVGQV